MKLKICIRDDDTSYYTTPDDIMNAYEGLWTDVPVSLGVIPFVSKTSQLMINEFTGTNQEKIAALCKYESLLSSEGWEEHLSCKPIGENKELTHFLKEHEKKGDLDILLHGHVHRYYESGPEAISGEISYNDLKYSKLYLESLFEKNIDTFIPPSNTLDIECLKNLSKNNMDILMSSSVFTKNIVSRLSLIFEIAKSNPKTSIENKFFGKPFSNYKLRGTNIFNSPTFGKNCNADQFKNRFDKYMKSNGTICIATHYHELLKYKNYRCELKRLLDILDRDYDVEFVRFREIKRLIK